MIKFERLSKDAKATIVRNGVKQPVYLGMTVSQAELDSLVVSAGEVLYTVNEEKIVTVQAPVAAPPAPEPAAPVAAKPAIVKPAPRTAKK